MRLELTDIPAGAEIDLIGELAAVHRVKAHLVGGGLRDLLLGRPATDLDFALGGAVRELPELFARRTGGTFFWLDEERGHARVVKRTPAATLTFDFAPLRGATIEEDLTQRDFTINALALSLADRARGVIDPLRGVADLRQCVIRACSSHAFSDDPLRLLRALRFAALLGFSIEDATWQALCRDARLLRRVTAERVRDELFRILAAPGIAVSLKRLRQAGLLAEILPMSRDAGRAGEKADQCLNAAADQAGRLERVFGLIERHFPRDCGQLAAYLGQEPEAGITILSLMKLAALLVALGGDCAAVAGSLRLGKRAGRVLEILCGAETMAMAVPPPTRRAMYRFFRDREPAGPALLIHAVAAGREAPQRLAEPLGYYCHEYGAEEEEQLLSGAEVMRILGIGPGRAVGEAMESLAEAERRGAVDSKGDAVAFLEKNLLTNRGPIS